VNYKLGFILDLDEGYDVISYMIVTQVTKYNNSHNMVIYVYVIVTSHMII